MRHERIMQIVKRDAQYSGILLIGRPIIERIDASLDRIGIRHEHLLSGRHINIFLDEFRPFFAINENAQMLDLAGKKRNAVAPDLPEYIMERDYVSAALRTARDLDAGEEEWNQFVEELRKRKG